MRMNHIVQYVTLVFTCSGIRKEKHLRFFFLNSFSNKEAELLNA